MQILQGVLANFAGIACKLTNGATLGVIGIGLNPMTMRWKLQSYHTVDKSLDGGSQGRKMSGQEKFAV